MCRCVCFVSIMLLNIIQYVSYIETGFTKINTMKNVKPNGCITQTLCSQLHYLFSVTLKKNPFSVNYSENTHYFCELAKRPES